MNDAVNRELAPDLHPDTLAVRQSVPRSQYGEHSEALYLTSSFVQPDAETAAPEPQPHHLLVWRQNDQTQWRSVEPFEADLLHAALAGDSFAELCERAAATQGEQAAAAVAGHLRVWVEAGLLTR